MMNDMIEKGSVAVSLAGRNKDKLVVVLRVDGNRAYVADGKEYKVAEPKPKNLKHLKPVGAVIKTEDYEFDSRLRKALKQYENQI